MKKLATLLAVATDTCFGRMFRANRLLKGIVLYALFDLLIGGFCGGLLPLSISLAVGQNPTYPNNIAGSYIASEYGKWSDTSINSTLAGSQTMSLQNCYQYVGTGHRRIYPIGTTNTQVQPNVQVTVVDPTGGTETVLPTAFSLPTANIEPATLPVQCSFTATFANAHGAGVTVVSGDAGIMEAANDAFSAGSNTVVVDPSAGATPTIIASITQPLPSVSLAYVQNNGAPTAWYSTQPTTLTALAVPTAAVAAATCSSSTTVCSPATTGGTWPNSAEHVGFIYVDALGNWSVASTDASYTPTGTTSTMLFKSPAASTGAVGWLPFAGLAYNSTSYVLPVTATNCTLSTTYTAYPICAIGANATMLGPVTTSALIPQSGGIAAAYNPNPQSHNAYGYVRSAHPGYQFLQNFGPFTATPALTAGQVGVLGTFQLPVGLLNSIGVSLRFTGDVTLTTSTTGTPVINVDIGDLTDFSTGTPKVICNEAATTAMGTAAVKIHFECEWTTNAIGTTGSIMPGGYFIQQLQAGTTTATNVGAETATGAVTADVVDFDMVYITFPQASAAESTTPPKLIDLHVEVL